MSFIKVTKQITFGDGLVMSKGDVYEVYDMDYDRQVYVIKAFGNMVKYVEFKDAEPIGNLVDENFETLCKDIEKEIKKQEPDMVNHPPHYKAYDLEMIDNMHNSMTPEEFRGYCKGNVMKYISRYNFKNGIQDLEKAHTYLGFLIRHEKGWNNESR